MIEGIKGAEEWMAVWRNKGDEGRVRFLLGRSVAEVKEKMLVRIRLLWKMCSNVGREGNI